MGVDHEETVRAFMATMEGELDECELRGDGIGGIAVHIGARVCSVAGASEVLVSGTLRDLVVGSGLEFDDRGLHELKGVPGEWRLFGVRAPHA